MLKLSIMTVLMTSNTRYQIINLRINTDGNNLNLLVDFFEPLDHQERLENQ